MSEAKSSFNGACHCGAVSFSFRIETPVDVTDCDCSLCQMTGYEHVFVAEEDLSFTSGRDQMVSYRFNTKTAEHLFCGICGVKPLYRPRSHPEAWSVNARCVDGLPIRKRIAFNGQNWEASIEGLHADLDE